MRFCYWDLSSLVSILSSFSGGERRRRGWDLPPWQRKGREIPSVHPWKDKVAVGLSCSEGQCWAGRWRRQGERGSDFLLTCPGVLGHLPLPCRVLIQPVKVWEREVLFWGEARENTLSWGFLLPKSICRSYQAFFLKNLQNTKVQKKLPPRSSPTLVSPVWGLWGPVWPAASPVCIDVPPLWDDEGPRNPKGSPSLGSPVWCQSGSRGRPCWGPHCGKQSS